MSLILGGKGYEAETAGTGQEALEKARKGVFDLALLDIRLPDMEGVDLLEPLKEMHPDMPVVMITAYASTETVMRALNGQAVAYITKPMDIDEMLARIEEALEKERLIREKRQVEEALREGEARSRALLEAVPDAIFRIDKQGTYTDFIPAKGFQTIVSPDEFLGRNQEEVLPPELAQESKHYLEQALQTGETQSYEYPLSFDGETRHYEARLVPIGEDEVLGIVRDVTERKQMEEVLRESEERYRLLADNVTDVIFTTDVNMRTTYVSPSITFQRGYTVEETMAHTFEEMMPPHSIPIVTKAFAEALAAEEAGEQPSSYGLEVELYCKDGSTMWTELRGSFVRDSEGQVVEILGVVRDISERKRAEEALRESEEKLRIMFDSVADAITVTDISGKIVDLNRAAVSIFGGGNREKWIGRDGFKFIAENSRSRAMEDMSKALEGESAGLVEYTFMREDGTEFECESSNALLRDALGNTVGFVSINRDITERKRTQEELLIKDRAMEASINAIDMVDLLGVDWTMQYVNPAFLDMWGYESAQEVLNRSAKDFWTNADELEGIVQALDEEGSWRGELEAVRKDGSTFDAQVSASVVRDEEDTPICLMGSFVDITERKRAEEALQESEERYRTIFNSASDAIFTLRMTDEGPRFIDYNTNALKLYRCKREELLDASPLDFAPSMQPDGSSSAERIAGIEVAAVAGQPQSFEWLHQRLDGTLFDGEVTVARVDIGGEGYLQAVVRDVTERKRAAEALRESEEKYRNVVERANDAIVILQDGLLKYANPMAEVMFGIPLQEAIDAPFAPNIDSDELPLVVDRYNRRMAGEDVPPIYEMALRHRDGTKMHVEVNAGLTTYEGRPADLIVVRDLTERKRAEQALRESEEKWRSLVENAPNHILIVDRDGVIQFINRARPETTVEETLGASVYDFVLPGYHEVLKESLRDVFDTAEPSVFEAQVSIPGGGEQEALWYHSMVAPIKHDDQVIAATLIATDVTERMKDQEALRQSEERFRSLVEATSDWIWEVDSKGAYTYCSPKVMDLLRFAPEELIGKTPFDLMAPEEASRVAAMFDDAVSSKSPIDRVENVNLNKDGHVVVLETSAVPIFGSRGDFVGYRGIDRDITERKLAEEELVRIREAVEGSSDAIGISDPEGHHFYHNRAFSDLFEWATAEELEAAGGGPAAYADHDVANDVFGTIMGGKSWRGEIDMVSKSGRRFPVFLRADAIRDDGGRTIGLIGIHTDITERKMAEEALRESEEKYREVVERANDGIIIAQDGVLRYCNPSAAQMFGYTTDEAVGVSISEGIHPDELPKIMDRYNRRMAGEDVPPVYETVLLRRDGTPMDFEINAGVITYDGKPADLIIARDVTERKQAEKVVHESEEKMRSLFENSPDIIMEIDRDGTLLFINFTVPGFTKEEVIGTPAIDYIAPEARDAFRDATARVFETGEPLRLETKGAGPDGRVSWYETRYGPVMRDGEVSSAMLIASDVTERREAQEQLDLYREHLEELVKERTVELEERTTQLEARSMELESANEQLQEADRLKSIFLASMSHELRTPLNSIIGFTGIILQGMAGELNEEQRRQLTMVKNSASHLLELINDLLDVSRVEAGRVDLWLEEFSLDDVVREVVETCLPMANEKGLDFRTEVPEDVILFTDRRRVKQILMNFASNAVKFSESGSVKIAASVLDGEKLEVQVTDTGIGIEEANISRLFKPFQQIDMSLPKRYEGTGLGLYLSKKLADILGGDISAQSKFGVGSEFTVVLPLKHKGGRDE